jgi:hypothetical protein
MFFHNERSYSKTFPMKLFFRCQTPAGSGGTTPLVDTHRVYKNIPGDVRSEFEREGWMFVRNFNAGFVLDNVLTAHGRDTYSGSRKILFAMAEPVERDRARELAALAH